MSKGIIAKPEDAIKSPEEAMKKAVVDGTSAQKRNNDILTGISNLAELQVMYAAITARNATRDLIGTGGPLAENITKTMESAGGGASALADSNSRGMHPKSIDKELTSLPGKLTGLLKGIAGDASTGGQKIIAKKKLEAETHKATDARRASPRNIVAGDMRSAEK